jgi:hypothetical protein
MSLRGSLGPIIEGQTISKAMVTLQDVELVSDQGAAVSLMSGSVSADLLSLQDTLEELVHQQAIEAGHFTELRFRLTSAWIETTDAENTTHVFASDQVDRSQFASVGSVSTLQLSGIGSDGWVSVALPQSGISVAGTASVAMHFSLAESLSVQSADVWVLQPRVWAVDASIFSSVDVQFEATSEYTQYFSQGFQVLLFDANLRPLCQAPLVATSSTLFAASFQYIEYYEGPYVAVLVPPSGVFLQSAIAVSIDIRRSVRVETRVSVTTVTQVSGTVRAGTLDVRTNDRAEITQRTSAGQVVAQTRQPVGPIEQVAPHTRPQEPLRPGEQPATQAPPPRVPGLPPPHNNVPADGGAPPPRVDGGERPPGLDAGERPPRFDAGERPPSRDAGERPPGFDAGERPPSPDAGVRPPGFDAGERPPGFDAGRPPGFDAGRPPGFDAGSPRQPPDAGRGPPPAGGGAPTERQPPSIDAGAPSGRPGMGRQPPITDAGAPTRMPPTGGRPTGPSTGSGGPTTTPPSTGSGGPTTTPPSTGSGGPTTTPPSTGSHGPATTPPSTGSRGRQGPSFDAGAAPPAKHLGGNP